MNNETKPLLVRQSKQQYKRSPLYDSLQESIGQSRASSSDSSRTDGNSSHVQTPGNIDDSILPGLTSKTMPTGAFSDSRNLTVWDRLTYYLPCFSWLPSYNLSKFCGDFVAGLSLASFQIPLAMSYATSIAHTPPICGLNSLAFTPFIYAVFGSVPQMIVGPESAISLVVGQAIERITKHDNTLSAVDLCVVMTFISGLILFVFGVLRFGFLDNVLSRALLRGFISAIGVVMVLNSLITELKLKKVFADAPGHYHSPFQKIIFLVEYGPNNYHAPTALLSFTCFSVLMLLRYLKKKLMKRHKWVVFFPEILFVVVSTIILSYTMNIKHDYKIDVVGDIQTDNLTSIKNPLSKTRLELFSDLFYPGFMVALLGFFESTTASKSLGTAYDFAISSNRELIALGSLNLVGSLFGALPSFGGYGRSKINAYSGAQTAISGGCMGLVTIVTIKFLLGFIRYVPVCVLSVVTTVVGISLFEEAPSDIRFHLRCRGYNELIIFTITVLTTFLFSVEAGITVGCAYSIIRLIKNSTKSRIQILGRVAGTSRFVNADEYYRSPIAQEVFDTHLEQIEGCLIVKIPEPLTFTNTEDLKSRLSRLEHYGSVRAHPASPKSGEREKVRNVIFDLHGMTYIDSSAAQILCEIITSYRKRHVSVYFARVPLTPNVRERIMSSGITEMIQLDNSDSGSAQVEIAVAYPQFFETIQSALKAIDTQQSPYISEVASVCTSLSNTYANSSLV